MAKAAAIAETTVPATKPEVNIQIVFVCDQHARPVLVHKLLQATPPRVSNILPSVLSATIVV